MISAHRDRWWERPIHGSSAASIGHSSASARAFPGWPARTVRRAAIMVVIYLVVLAFGLNQFRQTPVGFIPQVDGGYMIVVVQLPPGASLARTDAVQQRALDMALRRAGRRSTA